MKLSTTIFSFSSFLAPLFSDTCACSRHDHSTNANSTSPTCMDYPNWVDSYGDSCPWYELNDFMGCPAYGNSSEGGQGRVANVACCFCGGGINGTITPSPIDSDRPTKAPSESSCMDHPGWADIFGDNCIWYEFNDSPGCPSTGDQFEGDQRSANEACCYCGGGTNDTFAPTKALVTTTDPTLAPHTRAPVFTLCDDSEAAVYVHYLYFDHYSKDIIWNLSEVCTGSVFEM